MSFDAATRRALKRASATASAPGRIELSANPRIALISPPTPVRIAGAGRPWNSGQSRWPAATSRARVPHGKVMFTSDIVGCRWPRWPLSRASMCRRRRAAPRTAPRPVFLQRAQAAIAEAGAKRAILAHMHVGLEYQTMKRGFPAHIEPAFNGMVIEFEIGS